MADRRTDIITALESGMERTCAFFGALSAGELETKVYQDGAQWTVRQVLAHFVTIETSMQWLFRNILDGGPGSPRNFDVERFNREQPARYEGHSVDDLLAAFRAVREETITIVRDMSDQDLDRQGWHVFHGEGSLSRFICWAYEHAQQHESDIRTAIQH